ncbi:glycosyltransferase family 4 protein [Pelagibacterales bacterium SAG-MED47]|nr:glycosyltransferase family 4 protein [Pelagibacterales bacterium SAG-MED47]
MLTAIDMVGTNLNSGSKTYNLNFYKYLSKKKLNNPIYIFISNKTLKKIKINQNENIKFISKSNILQITFLRILWMQFILPFELKFLKVKQLYSPMNFTPLILKLFKIRTILCLHSNLPWIFFSKMPGNIIRNYITKLMMQFSINVCDHLIVTSNTAKDEIIKILSLNPEKVSSIYLGIDEKFLKNEGKEKNLISDFNYKNYILTVASCVKYHNIINILKAFKKLQTRNNFDLKFVLVMQILDKGYYKQIFSYIKKNFEKDKILIFSNLDNSYLIDLYKNAHFYVFSSYCEVFGLTSLEAMSQNCPVLISNRSALPEINSKAAEYFDPDDQNQIEELMNNILLNKSFREDLINRGNNHFKKFSWEKTVLETTKILNI